MIKWRIIDSIMNSNNTQISSLRNLHWQSVDSVLKLLLQRRVGKSTKFNSITKDGDKTVEKTFKMKKFICWHSKKFELNEFYHTFGIPGIWFHGHLPIKDFGKPEYLYHDERYGYYDFQIKNVEQLEQMLSVMMEINTELIALE